MKKDTAFPNFKGPAAQEGIRRRHVASAVICYTEDKDSLKGRTPNSV